MNLSSLKEIWNIVDNNNPMKCWSLLWKWGLTFRKKSSLSNLQNLSILLACGLILLKRVHAYLIIFYFVNLYFFLIFFFSRTGDFDFQNHITCQKNETHRLDSQLLASAFELGVWSSPTEFRILYPETQSNVTAIDPSSKSDMRLTEHVNKHRIAVLIVRAFEIPVREFCGGFSFRTHVHTENTSNESPNNVLKDIFLVTVGLKAVMDILSAKGICSSLKSYLIPFINVN